MDEDVQDVAAETTAPESSPEQGQPEDTAPASEGEITQPEETGERSVPYSRFKEVNDQLKELRATQTGASPYEQPYQQGYGDQGTGLDPVAEAKLQELVSKAIAPQLAGVTQYVREQQQQHEIEQARRQYPDFDQNIGGVTQALKDHAASLKNVENPLQMAYLIAKGQAASQAVDAARKQGVEEAYKSIDAKVAARPGSPVPKKETGGESELLKKFRAGQLSDSEMRANWTRLQEELIEAQSN